MLQQQSHDAFRSLPGKPPKPTIQHNLLFDELAAAARFGWRDYWQAERDERAAMVAYIRLEHAVQVMAQYDQMPRR